MQKIYDAIVIGAGPAGISASLYIKRAGFSVLVIYDGEGTLGKAEKIENYYGFPEALTGLQLFELGIKQAAALGIELVKGEVTSVEYAEPFKIETSLEEYYAKSIILSTGAVRKSLPNIGLDRFEGKGVSHCAVCDGFFCRGKKVAVLGAGGYALSEAQVLLPLAESVTILTGGISPSADFSKFETIDKKVSSLKGQELLEGIVFEDGSELAVSRLFVAVGQADASDFARKVGIALVKGAVSVDEKMATSVPGIFACGDVIGGLRQIASAVGEGAAAGMSAVAHIREKNK